MRRPIVTSEIRLQHGGRGTFALFDTGLCRTVCEEVLNGSAYPLLPEDVLPAETVKTIVDVGSNVGASCIYWLDCYRNAHVTAFEPCADAFELLVANTKETNCSPINVALGNADGIGTLFHNVEDDCCNSLTNHKSNSHEKVLLERARSRIPFPLDILKLDTEGSELAILSDIEAWLTDIKVLYLEYHSDDHRRRIDQLLDDTHTLWYSQATRPHRGTLCYVHHTLIPDAYNDWAIV